MLANEKISIAAHLHVLLRRKTGRVTDTEWMATNREYALEIVRFAREKAIQDGHADLGMMANRLAEIMALTGTSQAAPAPRATQTKAASEPSLNLFTVAKNVGDSEALQAPRYVAGLR